MFPQNLPFLPYRTERISVQTWMYPNGVGLMALSLASNIASLSAKNSVDRATNQISESFGRLSTGLRINSPSDDPAGLQMADDLRMDARLASVAVRNANDGLSATAIADSAMSEVGNILSRMAELAEQSSNGVFTNLQRSSLQVEFDALGSEVQRIVDVTKFNDIELVSDNTQDIKIQVGIDSTSDSQITIEGVASSLFSLGLTTSSGSTALTNSLLSNNFQTEAGAQAASLEALTALRNAMDTLSLRRGKLGASESRLTSAINYIAIARENFIAAESRIRDVDVAEEVAKLVQAQVIQQAATAVVAQANQQPSIALSLLL
jgi:flagellin